MLFSINWDDHIILILHFVYVVYHLNLFTDIVPTLYARKKSHLIVVYDLLFLVYFIDYAITVATFSSPLYHPLLCNPLPTSIAHTLSSCPWVVHISSLSSPFHILFLTFPCLFCTYHLCFLFPLPFYPLPLLPHPANNSPCSLHFYDSVPVLVVCLVCYLDSIIDSCEFIAILVFIILIFFFLHNFL